MTEEAATPEESGSAHQPEAPVEKTALDTANDAPVTESNDSTISEQIVEKAESDKPDTASLNLFAPEDWRQTAADSLGVDDPEKVMNWLGRYNTFADYVKGTWEARQKLSDPANLRVPDENSTEAEISAYRKQNNIPEDAGGYEVTLPEGKELAEAHKPFIEAITSVAHKHNMNSAAVSELASAFLDAETASLNDRAALDTMDASKTDAVLKDGWGNDHAANVNIIQTVLERAPEEARTALLQGRGPGGRALMNTPEVLDFLLTLGRDIYPDVTLLDNTGQASETIETELEKYKTMLREDPDKYYSKEVQDKVAQLYERQAAIEARKAA